MTKAKGTRQHDGAYRRLFSHAAMVEALLRRYVAQPWTDQLDFTTLELVPAHYVSQEHEQRESDLVWRLRLHPDGNWFYVYILLEFQSTADRFMAVRLLTYLLLFYEGLIDRKQLTDSGKLPPVLPVVLYNGRRSWRAPVRLAELVEPIGGGLETYVPRFEYLLLDEGHLPRETLEPVDNPVTAVFRLEQSREIEELRRVVHEVATLLGAGEELMEMRRDFAAWLRRVILPARFPGEAIPETGDLQEIDEMLAETVKTWPKQWLAQGREEGRQEGRQEGQREVLSLLLEERFGPMSADHRQRLARQRVAEARRLGLHLRRKR